MWLDGSTKLLINAGKMPRKGEGPGVSVRVLQRNGTNRICIQTERFIIQDLFLGLRGLTSPKVCSQQVGDPGKPVEWVQAESQVA